MNPPRDELLERYADAVAQDPRRPSERVRNAACAHAQLLRDQATVVQQAQSGAAARPAANQSQWTLSLVASLAVVGLASLMYLQIDRGAPRDRKIAMDSAAPSPTPPAAVDTSPKTTSKATEQFADARTESTGRRVRENRSAVLAPVAAPPPVLSAPPALPAPALPPAPVPAAVRVPPPMQRQADDMASGAATATATVKAKTVAPTAMQFLEAARTGNTPALQELLAQGAPINSRDDYGNTALMLAVRYRHATSVRKLLDLGADTALFNHEGLTALQIANKLGFAEIAETLLR